MKIVIEDRVPFIEGVFDNHATVCYLSARDINADALRDADALITRTRPKIDKGLLSESSLKIIATATIGTDHIDLPYCIEKNIKVVNAPGCNAPAVAQWVLRCIYHRIHPTQMKGMTIGIIGVGNVGSIVAQWAEGLGFNVLRNDPPRAEAEGSTQFVEMKDIVEKADIITFHTPLTSDGPYPTYHLADNRFFQLLKKAPFILNASRGEVVDTEAIIMALHNGTVSATAIDCWENEPNISSELVDKSFISTPHIAGYSLEGKLRATAAVSTAVADFFNIEIKLPFDIPLSHKQKVTVPQITRPFSLLPINFSLKSNPDKFEMLRDTYKLRREP